jgi:hypothetical protein
VGSRREVRLQAATAVRKVTAVYSTLVNAIRLIVHMEMQLLCPGWSQLVPPCAI